MKIPSNQLKIKELNWFFRGGSWLVRQTIGRFLPIRVSGLENLPRREPFIFAFNHISILDPPLICAYSFPFTRCMLSPVATKGLFVGPLGILLRSMNAFVVDRQNRRNLAALRQILKTLKTNPILIFPEGGVGPAEKRRSGKLGVGFLARKTGVPVVPATIMGTEKVLHKRPFWIRRHPVTIRVGTPLLYDPGAWDTIEAFTESVMEAIEALKLTGGGPNS